MTSSDVKRKSAKARKGKKTATRKAARSTFAAESPRRAAPETTMPVLVPFIPPVSGVDAVPVPVTYFELPGLKEAQTKLSGALKNFMDALGKAIQDAATLEVETYVSDNLENVNYVEGKFAGGAELRAMTAIALDGDIKACVPTGGEGIDQALWAVHVDMVAQAQSNRTELMKMALSAASAVVSTLRPA